MASKCIICDDPAEYKIKDTLDYYCGECADENFSDLSILLKVEEEAQRLQKFLREKIDPVKLNDNAQLGEEKDEEDLHEMLDTSEEEGEFNNESSNEEE